MSDIFYAMGTLMGKLIASHSFQLILKIVRSFPSGCVSLSFRHITLMEYMIHNVAAILHEFNNDINKVCQKNRPL